MGGDDRRTTPAPKSAAGRWPRAVVGRLAGLFAILAGLAVLVGVVGLPGCQRYQANNQDRVRHALRGRGPLVIAVVASSSAPNLTWEGAQLAAKQINARGGVLKGRQIQVRRLDDQGRLSVAEGLARKLADDEEVAVVVGHVYSEVAVPVSIIYGVSGLLFISTGATDPQLSLIPNPLSLRVVPNDGETALALAELARKLGLTNLVVMFQRGLYGTFYGQSLSGYFSAVAGDHGLNVLHVRSFFPWQDDLRPMLAPLRKEKIDGLVTIGFLPQAGQLISQARGLSIRATILASDSLDDSGLLKLPNQAAEGVIVASFFRPDLDRAATRAFVADFQRAYGKPPDDNAAATFDAVNLIAAAAQSAGSSVPLDMANAITYMENVQGAASRYNFDPDGDPIARWIWFKEVMDNRFVFLPNEYQPQDPGQLTD